MSMLIAMMLGCGGSQLEPAEVASPSPSAGAAVPAKADLSELQAPVEVKDEMPQGSGMDLSEIEGDGGSQRPVSLCELVRLYPQRAGHYRVNRLVGYSEEAPGGVEGVTYVELEALQTQGPEAVRVARISGGPVPPNQMQSWDVSLAVDDEVVLLFERPALRNLGYHGLDPLTVFRRQPNGGYSNGQLFTQENVSAAQLLARIDSNLRAPSGCAEDAQPDYGVQPEETRVPDGQFEGHTETGHGGL